MSVVSLSDHGGGPRGTGARPTYLAALDIGSTKISCLIARVMGRRSRPGDLASGRLQIVGVGHTGARGIRGGCVVDLDAAEQSVRLAVDAAERMANVTVESVFVNVSGGRPMCHSYVAQTGVRGPGVDREDVARVVHMARAAVDPGNRTIIHTAPVDFTLDGNRGIRRPEGMFGEALGVDLNVITVDPGPMRNLAICVERCHLGVDGFAIASHASGLATLVDDEKDLGVTCIDMGGGTTNISIFFEGRMIFADSIPVGGTHVTSDIARGLSTSYGHAERMKTLYGSALPSVSDDREIVAVPLVGEHGTDAVNKIPKSMLTGIVQPRLEELLELVRDRIEASGFSNLAGRRVVLTGGASQMTGLRVLAATVLDRQVRLATPQGVAALPENSRGPAFSTPVGLLHYAMDPVVETELAYPDTMGEMHPGYLRRVGQWIRESF